MSIEIKTYKELKNMRLIKKKFIFVCNACGTNLKKFKTFKAHKCLKNKKNLTEIANAEKESLTESPDDIIFTHDNNNGRFLFIKNFKK